MKKTKYIILTFICLCLSGCYNYRELNDLSIVSGIGVDKVEEGYLLTIQIINTIKQSSDSNTSDTARVTVREIVAPTIQEAFRQMLTINSKRIYANQVSLLIISEDVATNYLPDILDIFVRDTESRKEYAVVISKDCQASEVLDILTSVEVSGAHTVMKSLESIDSYYGITHLVTFNDFLYSYLDEYRDVVLPSVTINGNLDKGSDTDNLKTSNPDAKIVISDMAVFKDNKLVGWLEPNESIALSFIRNDIDNTLISNSCDNNKHMVIEIIDSKTNIKVKNKENKIIIKINSDADISEITCDLDLSDPNTIKLIQQIINNNIENMIKNSIKNVIEKYNSDIFGFRSMFYKENASYFKKHQNNEEILKNINLEVKVNIDLFEKGNILQVIDYDKEN